MVGGGKSFEMVTVVVGDFVVGCGGFVGRDHEVTDWNRMESIFGGGGSPGRGAKRVTKVGGFGLGGGI